ncbi:2-succinyl-6-hydroxy-2,4-cyclohexadiene-1-carboxylate synthase [Aureibacillus halotolerans]|uniref:Putative 2-succinyl-6-hydroxy-2,4-cyclohexadiene-1-carboxylate synthase n=1 Tax=Aureibacillus halotolerans TaxID=1508390 RepID=A0A4R6UB58_9BACI|nr:2-succinyl-6-hydroxy-2,4-cyclohexadiene-1-carboxylate synthase [Aureibacillus halotolerans]TDQ40304.1 2-succinyl-6-hydroxy-2,4-cyclohexadiene-1-carboxylate synthase [Aureibacillus halotolerans]
MYFQAKDISYHYHDQGSKGGQTLLLLHGFTASLEAWEPFVSLWSQHARVVSVDLPGHGKTMVPADPSRVQVQSIAEDLCALLDALDIQEAIILGYSMGGRVALAFGSMFPEKTTRLVLESASPGLRTESEREQRKTQDNQLAEKIKQSGMPAFVAYWRNIELFASQKNLPQSVREHLDQQRLQNSVNGLAVSLQGMGTGAQDSYWEALSFMKMPVILVVGELDHKFRAIAEEMHAILPNATLQVCQNAGHAIHLESPAWFATIVMDMIHQQRKDEDHCHGKSSSHMTK